MLYITCELEVEKLKKHTKSINKYGEKERYRSHDHCDSEQK